MNFLRQTFNITKQLTTQGKLPEQPAPKLVSSSYITITNNNLKNTAF